MDPNSHEVVALWPEPTSRYAVIRHAGTDTAGRPTHSSLAVGIGYCATCEAVPEIIPHGIEVVEMESAKARYENWYSDAYGMWLRAHARDYLKLDDVAIGTLMDTWERDRTA